MSWFSDAVTTVATGGLNKVAENKHVQKAVNKITAPVGKRVGAVATAMRLPSIAKNINIKKALTNPVGYAKDNAMAYAQDATVAVSIYSNLKKGNVKGLVMQGVADTKGAAKALQTGKAPAVAWTLDQPKLPPLIQADPTYSQLVGDNPYEVAPVPAETPGYVEQSEKQSKTMPIMIAAAAAIVLLVVVLK